MGAKYAETGQESAVTSGLTTVLHVTGGTGLRIRIYDLTVSCSGTPADNAVRWALMRHTVTPTSTALTPTPLDPADPAAEATAGENASVEGTYTAGSELFDQHFNQRAAYRWVAAPGGELIVPATASNGIGARVLSTAYTGTADATIHHEE
jgi:hypothetical protein